MKRSKVIAIALDAADTRLASQWATEGYLPNIAKLLRQGTTATIETPPGVLEGAIWPTLLTSTSAATHAMFAYMQMKPGTYDLEVAMMADRLSVPPFWAYLSQAGKCVAVIDAPFAKPVENLNGIQVTNWGGHDLWSWSRCSWPKSLMGEVIERFGEYPVPHCDVKNRSIREYQDLRNALLKGVEKKTNLLRYCLKMQDWDFFFGVYSESHCAGHQLWHFMDSSHPRHDPQAPVDLRDCLRDVYTAIDAGIGEILEDVSAETSVVLLLTHGMGAYYHGSHLIDEILERSGVNDLEYASAEDNGTARSAEKSSLRHSLWATRHLIPRLLRERVKASPLRQSMNILWWWSHPEAAPIHPWSVKRAFQLPESNMTGLIRINVKGREPAGLVAPGDEYEALCRKLTDLLLGLIDPVTGRRAVQWVARAKELYRGPRLNELPDLFVEWDHSAPITKLYSPQIGTVEGEFSGHRTGSHWRGGLLVGAGPRFRSGRMGQIQTIDIAPTLLDFFNESKPASFEGKSCLPLLTNDAPIRAA